MYLFVEDGPIWYPPPPVSLKGGPYGSTFCRWDASSIMAVKKNSLMRALKGWFDAFWGLGFTELFFFWVLASMLKRPVLFSNTYMWYIYIYSIIIYTYIHMCVTTYWHFVSHWKYNEAPSSHEIYAVLRDAIYYIWPWDHHLQQKLPRNLRFVLHLAEGDATKGSDPTDGRHLETLGTYTTFPWDTSVTSADRRWD